MFWLSDFCWLTTSISLFIYQLLNWQLSSSTVISQSTHQYKIITNDQPLGSCQPQTKQPVKTSYFGHAVSPSRYHDVLLSHSKEPMHHLPQISFNASSFTTSSRSLLNSTRSKFFATSFQFPQKHFHANYITKSWNNLTSTRVYSLIVMFPIIYVIQY